MTKWEKIKKIEEKFLLFQNNHSFLTRERIYKGSTAYGEGLQPIHKMMIQLAKKFKEDPIPEKYLEFKKDIFEIHTKKLEDTLELLMFVIENDSEANEITKLFAIIKLEIIDLDEFYSQGFNFDPSSIKKTEELSNLRIFNLGQKIEDNFNQLSLSSEWRIRKTSLQSDQKIDFNELELLIEKAKIFTLTNLSEDFLKLLSIIAINIRDTAATNLFKLKEYLLLYITVSKILGKDLSFKANDKIITSKDIKDDIEHKVNLKNLDWLVKLHNSIIEDHTEEHFAEEFSLLLYELSRDVREEFFWTMLRLAREQQNEELENISIAYASLASMLLSINDNLKEAGFYELSKAITEADEIKVLDIIDDISEIYSFEVVSTEKFINTIRKQLENLKQIADQIIQLEDIRPTFQMIVQITDMDAKFEHGQSLEEYIHSMGN